MLPWGVLIEVLAKRERFLRIDQLILCSVCQIDSYTFKAKGMLKSKLVKLHALPGHDCKSDGTC